MMSFDWKPSEQDARVSDYLDDKLQTAADLASLDGLLLSVRRQQSILQQQLQDAQKQLHDARHSSNEQTESLKSRVAKFKEEQRDIDEKLTVITASETSDEATRKFEVSMQKLQVLDTAKGYLEILRLTESLSQNCLESLGSDNDKALSDYKEVRRLLEKMGPLQDTADGAAPHLIDHVRSTAERLRSSIQQSLTHELEKTLREMKWPKSESIPAASQQDLTKTASQLLSLQLPDLEEQEKATQNPTALVLLPLAVLVKPLELGFRYHFEGDRPTNRLERPEFFLNHVLDRILSKYAPFVAEISQPVLTKAFRNTPIAYNYSYLDATSAFITALLPMVRTKLDSILPTTAKNAALLSHLVHELIQFDSTLRDEWDYDGGYTTDVWIGLAGEVLNSDDMFSTWLKAERDFALARYHEIVDAPDSFNLDFDSLGHGKTKPTLAAIRVNDLLEAVTDNYRDLAAFSHKFRFLLNIQISLFDLFHARLAEALSAYLSRTSTIGRTSREEQGKLQGLAGLESLCRVYGSADYLECAMRDWNDDVFFLDLYTTLHHRTQTDPSAPLWGQTTAKEIAPLTSIALTKAADPGVSDTMPPGALFDQTASSYARLRTRAEEIISSLLANAAKTSMSRFTRTTHWATLSPSLTPSESNASSSSQSNSLPNSSTTPELDPLLDTLSSLLGFLAKALGTVPLRRVTLQLLETLEERFMDMLLTGSESSALPGAAAAAAAAASNVVKRESRSVLLFSLHGARQFRTDVDRVGRLVANVVDGAIVESGLGKLMEAVQLLCIPVERRRGHEVQDEEDADKPVDLYEVQRRLLGSGEEAREFLDEMGLERLGVGEARKILARRVENGG
jgi:RAD50-interacting protein 1